MEIMNLPLLSLLIALPLVGALSLIIIPSPTATRWITLGFVTADLLLAALLLWLFDGNSHQMQFRETLVWILLSIFITSWESMVLASCLSS